LYRTKTKHLLPAGVPPEESIVSLINLNHGIATYIRNMVSMNILEPVEMMSENDVLFRPMF